jgi:hypothetical protein
MRLIELTEAEAHGVIEALSVYLQTCREDDKDGAERRCLRAVLHKVHQAQCQTRSMADDRDNDLSGG